MFKALLKKQFLELNQSYFRNRKTGKNRSAGGTVAFVALFALIFLSLGFFFYEVASFLCAGMAEVGMAWLFFAIMGLMSLFLGVFGSVFNTYAGLYKAKDNELLLSMPIPPMAIVGVRTIGVYAMSLLYGSLIWVPSLLAYWVILKPGPAALVFGILLDFVLALVVTVLTCLLGWLVAQVAGRVQKKSFVTVLASLLFFAAYYFFYFKLNSFMQGAVANAEAIGQGMKTWGLPLYALGRAATGQGLPMLVVTLVSLLLFLLACVVMSRSFLKLSGEGKQAKAKVYKQKDIKASGLDAALLGKELRRFGASPTYMLNGGLGILIMLGLAVAALIKAPFLRELVASLHEFFPNPTALAGVVAACILGLIVSMDAISAPSISLEGKNLWILQSMPIPAGHVLKAKQRLHLLLNLLPALLALLVIDLALGAGFLSLLAGLFFLVVKVLFDAAFGLLLDLRRPNLNWTNEAVPVKQNLSVLFVMLLGWLLAGGCGAAAALLCSYLDCCLILFLLSLVIGALALLLRRWLSRRGAELFSQL